MKSSLKLLNEFKIPIIVFLGILFYLSLNFLGFNQLALVLILGTIALGSFDLIKETIKGLLEKRYALDYIAILAVLVSIYSQEYLVASVIALMLTSGQSLEDYGAAQAKKNLTNLIDRIPDEVILWEKNSPSKKLKIKNIKIGQQILIRKGEVIPLDSELISKNGLTDESSLTGEPYMIEKISGDDIRSGTVNVGEAIVIKVKKTAPNSTYSKIIEMVKTAQSEKSPFIRLADKYSTYFTLITLTITGITFFYTQSLERVLAVLVIATPCPLILATPIALIGGVNAAAKRKIIVKKLAAIEALSRAKSLIFDKTGTITLGVPVITSLKILNKKYHLKKILAISEAIERNSLHPLAKAIVTFAKSKKAPLLHATKVEEKIGQGIFGTVENVRYGLEKLANPTGMAIELKKGSDQLAIFHFEDQIKSDSKDIINSLQKVGLNIIIFTGDKKSAARKIIEKLDSNISFKAECTPQDKLDGINALQKNGKIVAMVGDGINDAPALAKADVGLVFSNEEQTAASEAADIVFLGGNFSQVKDIIGISQNTIKIALQSIGWGIGISVSGMVIASFGAIPPIMGAIIQEGIDVIVILNALRARNYN